MRSPRTPDAERAVAEFWGWWQGGGRTQVERLVTEGGDLERDVPELLSLGQGIDPDLDWVLESDGTTVTLALSGGGDPRLRALTERWRAAAVAEPPGSTWRFLAAAPASDHLLEDVLDVGGIVVDPARGTFALEELTERWLAPTFAHPALDALDAGVAQAIAEHVVISLLGEDLACRWVAEVRAVPAVGPEATVVAPTALLDAVAAFGVRQATEEQQLVEDVDGEERVVGRVRRPLHWVDTPTATTHLALSGAVAGSDDVEARAGALLSALTDVLGHDGVVVGALWPEDTLLLHAYAVPSAGARARVETWAAGEGLALEVSDEPGWDSVAALV